MSEEDDVQFLEEVLFGSGSMPHLNDQNRYGDTPLIVAVLCNNCRAAKLLLDVGADPNARGEYGIMASQCALRQGNLEMLALLQESGAETCDDVAMDAE